MASNMPVQSTSLDPKARALYEASDNQSVPTWDQLGEVTKGVWRGYVQKEIDRPKNITIVRVKKT